MSSASIVFRTAQDAFRATLPIEERARYAACYNPDDLVESLRDLEVLTKQGQERKLGRYLKVLEQLNTRLQPYFDTLNVVAGVQDVAALTYGAVRVVLQLAAALPTFFDRLLSAISRLSDTFPQYEAIVALMNGRPSVRMRQHLEKVYHDFFEFLRLAAKVFTASSGRIKRPVEMMASVIWKPFDARFSDILAQMDYHRMFIMDELEILQAQHTEDADRAASLERAFAEKERSRAEDNRRRTKDLGDLTMSMKMAQEREIKDSSVRRIADWLAAPLFADTLQISQEHRIKNTAQWIFQMDRYRKWLLTEVAAEQAVKWKAMPPWVLWVHGNPGCGKTMMASSVYDMLNEEKSLQQHDSMVCYFFFKHTDPKMSSIEAAYRSALSQVLYQYRDNSEILDKFLFIQSDSNSSSGQHFATAKQLYDLMCISAQTLGHIKFVVDGVDEANDPDDVSERLKDLVTAAPVKLICFSRSNISRLQYFVPIEQRIAFNREMTNPDIRAFLEFKISEMMEEGKLPSTADVRSLVGSLLKGADGMFLWAKLMIRYLRSPALSGNTKLRVIQSVHLPEGLDAMYDRIASLIMSSCGPELKLAKDILLWIQYSITINHGPSVDWLCTAVGNDWDPNEKADFVAAAITVCSGLIEFDRGSFHFTHLTAREYLEKESFDTSGKGVLLPPTATATPELASRCIEHLMAIAPMKLPSNGWSRNIYDPGESRLDFHKSFDAYASVEWVYLSTCIPHEGMWISANSGGETLPDAHPVARLKATITRFLDNPLAVGLWIENLFAIAANVQPVVDGITKFNCPRPLQLHNTDRRLVKQLTAIAEDLKLIEKEWGPKLLEKPYLIWTDVTLFSKLEIISRLDTSKLGTVSSLSPIDTRDASYCEAPLLCSISSTSAASRVTGVLSIIPSAEFVQFWQSANRLEAYAKGEGFCKGWVANYEIWSQDSKSRLARFEISLTEREITILLRQSFREEAQSRPTGPSIFALYEHGTYKTSFPLAIGPDCLTFAVLRTIYRILPSQSKPMTAYQSSLLPLECLGHFRNKWGEELQTFNPNYDVNYLRSIHAEWRDWYTYSISFSPDSKMLSFADYRQPCQVTLAIFEVHHDPTLSLQLIHSTKAMLGSPRVKEMHFHPRKSLIVFLAETKVWMWNFGGRGVSGPVHLATTLDGYRENPHTLTRLSFSMCGEFVLASNDLETVVVQLPRGVLFDTDHVEYQRPSKRKQDEYSLTTNPPLGSLVRLGADQGLLNRTLSGAHLSMTGDVFSTMTLVPEGNNISLKLSSPSETARRQIVALPDTLDMRDKAISVRFPETPDEHLVITLDKTATEGYTLDKDRSFSHATVIEKDVQLVENIVTTASSASPPPRKRLRGVQLISLFPHNNGSGDDT